jgi:hypothetical protein
MPWKWTARLLQLKQSKPWGSDFPSKRSLAPSQIYTQNNEKRQQKQLHALRELEHGRVGPYLPYYPTYLPDVSKGYNQRQVGS